MADVPMDYRCAATGKPLYMPVITTEGIAYSYVALFSMFVDTQAPTCKVTGNTISFFPSVCLPLHHWLLENFEGPMKGQRKQDKAQLEEYGFQMPLVSDKADAGFRVPVVSDKPPEDEGHTDLLQELECAVSGELVYAPCVLSSGTIVSAYCVPEGGFRKDPNQLVGCAMHNQAPQRAAALEAMIRERFPQEYDERGTQLFDAGFKLQGKFATGTSAEFNPDDALFLGVGCDGCGLWPIRGEAWYDTECPENTGFHLCGGCYRFGYHKRATTGKFGQTHMPKNTMAQMHESNMM